nr:uncharacterized protein LOC123573066 [Macaca fascicularis]
MTTAVWWLLSLGPGLVWQDMLTSQQNVRFHSIYSLAKPQFTWFVPLTNLTPQCTDHQLHEDGPGVYPRDLKEPTCMLTGLQIPTSPQTAAPPSPAPASRITVDTNLHAGVGVRGCPAI